ncbi:MAG: nucleotidyltransferase domain-containing protein [Nitrospirota bacterium]
MERAAKKLRKHFPGRIIAIYAFGSRVRGDHNEWSDFDVLVLVKDKNPELVDGIIEIFADEEYEKGIFFSPVIKDITVFEREKQYNTPFYQNIKKEGVLL